MKMTIAATVLLVTVASGCTSSNGRSDSARFHNNDRNLALQSVIHSGDNQSDIRAKLRSRGIRR